MNKNNHDDASDTDDSDQSGLSSQHEDQLLAACENIIAQSEIVVNNEAEVLKREKFVTLHEKAADQREGKAASSTDHMTTLQ